MGADSDLFQVAASQDGPWHLWYGGSATTPCGLSIERREWHVSKALEVLRPLCSDCAVALEWVNESVDEVMSPP